MNSVLITFSCIPGIRVLEAKSTANFLEKKKKRKKTKLLHHFLLQWGCVGTEMKESLFLPSSLPLSASFNSFPFLLPSLPFQRDTCLKLFFVVVWLLHFKLLQNS